MPIGAPDEAGVTTHVTPNAFARRASYKPHGFNVISAATCALHRLSQIDWHRICSSLSRVCRAGRGQFMANQGGELDARYANYFAIGFNAVEFVLDFGQFFFGSEAPRIHTRIITNSIYAKRLW